MPTQLNNTTFDSSAIEPSNYIVSGFDPSRINLTIQDWSDSAKEAM
jgi:hypothetical protein